MSIRRHAPFGSSRYDSFVPIGFARTQKAYLSEAGTLKRYSAVPSFSFEKLLIQSPADSWPRLTLSYHHGWRFIVWRAGFFPSIQMVAGRAAGAPTSTNAAATQRMRLMSIVISQSIPAEAESLLPLLSARTVSPEAPWSAPKARRPSTGPRIQ